MTKKELLAYLAQRGSSEVISKMEHFGVVSPKAFGVSAPVLRALVKNIGTDHTLALSLWKSGYYEARIVAAMLADPVQMTEHTVESWVRDFDSWAVCDACCSELFSYTPFAVKKVFQWSKREEEFVKRAGFVLMAAFAVHCKDLDDALFLSFLPLIKRESHDPRNFVRKGVNWGLRQIGKRNPALNSRAKVVAREMIEDKNPVARWIGTDAIKDLNSEPTKRKFARMKGKK